MPGPAASWPSAIGVIALVALSSSDSVQRAMPARDTSPMIGVGEVTSWSVVGVVSTTVGGVVSAGLVAER
jgi:hypothetical protein